MKKLFLFGVLAAALGFCACSTEDELMGENTQKGMVLKANVVQSNTRATITQNDTSTDWGFAFDANEQIEVTNNLISTSYTFKKTSANFTCAEAQPTETATDWYAYYPSAEIDLTNQSGTLKSAANLFALAGTTNTTGEDGLNIDMKPQAAILKIVNNTDNAIDIRLNNWTYGDKDYGNYIKGLKANADGFEVVYNGENPCSLLKASSKGTFYIIIPAKMNLRVYNGDDELARASYPSEEEKEQYGVNGIEPGEYYTISIDYTNLRTGIFSVAADKKVQFTSGALYYYIYRGYPEYEDFGSVSEDFHPQTEYNFLNPEYEYPYGHVQHLYWNNYMDYSSQTASYCPWDDVYTKSSESAIDEFWCSENHPLTIYGADGLYALSSAEWTYLLNTRTKANTLYKYPVTVDNDVCLVIAPDDFEGNIADEYNWSEWYQAKFEGLIFLPCSGTRTSQYTWNAEPGLAVWTSTPDPQDATKALYLTINPNSNKPEIASGSRSNGYMIRLVRNVK